MFNVGVYVTSRYADYVEFKNALNEAIKKYITVGKPNALCTGSAKSNSSGNGMVRRYAFENGIPCRIFETQWEKHIPTKPGKRNTAGVRANAMIVKNSNGCCLFWTPTSVAKWDFMSGGCYNFRKMCGKMGRELIPIKVDIYKPLTKDETDHKDVEVEERPIGNIGGGKRASDLLSVGDKRDDGISSKNIGGGSPSYPAAEREVPVAEPSDVGMDISTPPSTISTASTPSPAPSNANHDIGGKVVNLPVDVTGDGLADMNIAAVDTDGNGTLDSMMVPVDSDGNGSADTVKIEPLPSQIVQNAIPQSTVPQKPSATPAATANTPIQNKTDALTNTVDASDDEDSEPQL